ncbi:MAG: hypothetical protein MHMPM18_004004 [Marteilia pararefringens]
MRHEEQAAVDEQQQQQQLHNDDLCCSQFTSRLAQLNTTNKSIHQCSEWFLNKTSGSAKRQLLTSFSEIWKKHFDEGTLDHFF